MRVFFLKDWKKRKNNFIAQKGLIKENPYIGHVIQDDNILEFSIPNMMVR